MTTQEILTAARDAKGALALATASQRNSALLGMAAALEDPAGQQAILAANAQDLEAARGHISDVMLDRLALNEARLAGMAQGIREVAALPDPVGAVLRRIERPNGLVIEKTAVPMGVIAIIYESRPNVTSDAAALALKSGNVCVLRCGKEAWRSSRAIVEALRRGVAGAGLPVTAVNLIEDTTHASANQLMTAVGYVDLLIPRGGAGLIRACVENAKVPCIQTGTGICHIYVDDTADQDKALRIIENAKASRPSVCNAEEVCLVHKDIAAAFLPRLAQCLGPDRAARGLHPVELRLDERAAALIPGTPAGPRDFDTEFFGLHPGGGGGGRCAAGHRPHCCAFHRPQRRHPQPDPGPYRPVLCGGGQRGGVRQLFHPLHRRGRVRAGLRNGHLHPEAPCPGPHGPGRAVHLQIHRPRGRPDPLTHKRAVGLCAPRLFSMSCPSAHVGWTGRFIFCGQLVPVPGRPRLTPGRPSA